MVLRPASLQVWILLRQLLHFLQLACLLNILASVQAYLARIAEVNTQGPGLRAVLETNPSALQQAAQLDEERKNKATRSPLHGIPLLIKDNIATLYEEGMRAHYSILPD